VKLVTAAADGARNLDICAAVSAGLMPPPPLSKGALDRRVRARQGAKNERALYPEWCKN
jgi:hypothetical protein